MENTSLILHWYPDIPALLLAAIFTAGFYKLTRFRFRKNNLLFTIAVLSFLLLLSSPLDYLAMHTYLTAHMVIHVILLLVCGPLLALSLTGTGHPLPGRLSRFFNKYAWCAWLTGVGIMWLWHVPMFFDMTMVHNCPFPVFGLLQTASLLVGGMLFSWPLIGPGERWHIHALSGIIYLFTACVSCSLLGLLLTFAPADTYQHYHAMSVNGYNPWDLNRGQDSEAAGLIMWVPCCFVYLSGCLWLLYRWFAGSNGVKFNNAL